MILRCYIGHDTREQDAYDVCAFSMRRHCTKALHIQSLKHRPLRKQGLFSRPWHIDESGQFIDQRDGRPFSTEFAFTRFLVPELARKEELAGWVLFCDCDFLFQDDIAKLFSLADDSKAIMCVQHSYAPPEGMKMDGMAQLRYGRKNWSSLILWNLNHPANDRLTSHEVNYQPGWWLHGFRWLQDSEIGKLPESWNWLAGWSDKSLQRQAIHYTQGGPWMEGYERADDAQHWLAERTIMKTLPELARA